MEETIAPPQQIERDATATGLVCTGDPDLERVIVRRLEEAGFEVVGVTDRAMHAIEIASSRQPHVAVVDLVSSGQLGVRVIGAIRAVAPSCEVVVVLTLDTMRPAVLAAGALDAVDKTDLRDLSGILHRVSG